MKYTETLKEKSLNKWIKKKEWHRYFAWYPVEIGLFKKAWLETVERRKVCSEEYLGLCWWEYRVLS